MVHTVIVSDTEEIHRLAGTLPKLSDGMRNTKCVPIFSTGRQQLILMQNGTPWMSYRVAGYGSDSLTRRKIGLKVMERYLDSFDDRKHLVVMYDDPGLARAIEFRYIKVGLETMRQQCIYAFASDDVDTPEMIRRQMDEYGIDTYRYLESGLLKFLKLQDPAANPDGFLAGATRNIELIAAQITRPPVRVVAHQRYQFDTVEELQGEVNAENFVESSFATFQGSLLCNHYVSKKTVEEHGDRIWKILKAHDNVFLVRSSADEVKILSTSGG